MSQHRTEKLYTFASLERFSPAKRLSIRVADRSFYGLINFIGRTTKFETEGDECLDSIKNAGLTPIFATWHDRILLGTYFLRGRGIVFLTSQSFDGEYIARFLQRFGYGVVRGSSSRGGARALAEMIREMKQGTPMGFTVDGPKGPRYAAKPGPVLLAKKTGNPILPFIIEPAKYGTVNSWDRLQIPRPWSRARVFFAEPVYVTSEASDAELEEKRVELERALLDLVERGRAWRERV